MGSGGMEGGETADLGSLLRYMVESGASDLVLATGTPPRLRHDGRLRPLSRPALTPLELERLLTPLIHRRAQEDLDRRQGADRALELPGLGRFRVNLYRQQGALAAAVRRLNEKIPTPKELGLPPLMVDKACRLGPGLVLVTGPTGSGKSTTLAALVDHINSNEDCAIITLEDPVEYRHESRRAVLLQRELGQDVPDYPTGLHQALRQNPDVVLVGEMRSPETIGLALTVAETGHLTYSTLHTSSAVGAVNRIVDSFEGSAQAQVRSQLADALRLVVAQKLLPGAQAGRVLVLEVLVATHAVRALIREGKTHMLPNQLTTGAQSGMWSFDQALAARVREGAITRAAALAHAADETELLRNLDGLPRGG